MPRDRDRLSAAAESPDYRFVLAVARSERLGHRRMITATLRHFALREFSNPTLVENQAAVWLDDIRDAYGAELTVTRDACTVAEEAALPGHAEPPESSLHVAIPEEGVWGRAFDLRWVPDAAARFRLVTAILQVSAGRPIELEFVPFGHNSHIHAGLLRNGRPSVLIFSEV